MICTLLIIVGFCSCEKNEHEPQTLEAFLTIVNTSTDTGRDGGDDDEEPAIQGEVEDANGQPLSGARVELVPSGKTAAIRSEICDSQGEFAMTAPAGDYYFRVTPVGGTAQNTAVFTLLDDVTVTITLE